MFGKKKHYYIQIVTSLLFFNLIYKYHIATVKDLVNVYTDNFICVVLLKKKMYTFF